MKIEVRKFALLFASIGVFVTLSGFGLLYYQLQGQFEVDSEKYPEHIGYLSPGNRDFSENYQRCSEALPIGFYHSTAPHIYKGGKPAFRRHIRNNYRSANYTDTGYLGLRFLIDCDGDLGDLEVNELNADLQLTELSDAVVDQLIALTMQPANWENLPRKAPRDLYMYVLFKLADGKVVEILP